MARPTIGICAAVERATFGVWVDEPAALVPISYVRAVQASRGLALVLPPDGDAVRDPAEILGQDPHRPVPGSWADHPVRLQPGSLAARVAGAERLEVKSHHHQGIADLGDAIEVSGWSDDPADPDTIEAIEFPDRSFALGVLWHPEEDTGDRVIPAFVERLLASVEP